MKKINYLLFSILCLFGFSIVFAEEVVIKSITPSYDKTSTIEVTEEENLHSVIFNDKNQKVEYNIVIENTAEYDVIINDIILSTPTEEFLEYTLAGANKEEKLAKGETKEIAVTLETVPKEGWGRNFSDDLVAEIYFEKVDPPVIDKIEEVVTNPETRDTFIISLISIIGITTLLIYLKKKKIAYYVMIIGIAGTTFQIANASTKIIFNFNVNANFESQNIMEPAKNRADKYVDYWQYYNKIKNIYIANEFSEITNYAYRFDVSDKKDERVIAYLVVNTTDSNYYDLYLQADGIIYANPNASDYFSMNYLDNIENLKGIDTSLVTDMTEMFSSVGSNSNVFTLNLGDSFNTSNVENMSRMFENAGYNNPNFTLDLGTQFDTSNVTNMGVMFFRTGYANKSFTLDLGEKFNTKNATYMFAMFYETGYSSTIFTLDLGDNFDTSNVTSMENMFIDVGHSNTAFTLDLGDNFNTSNVKNMQNMFHETGYNSKTFTLDLGDKFDTSKVEDMYGMFYSTGYVSKNFTLDLGDKFDTSNVTNMSFMFAFTGALGGNFTLDLGENFDTSKVTSMNNMFYGTGWNSNSFKLDLGDKFDTSNVTTMYSMFSCAGNDAQNFTLDLGDKFDTSKVTNMSEMFYQTGQWGNSFTLDLGDKFDTSNVTNMSKMFYSAGYNNPYFTLDIGDKFDTSKVTNMDEMFRQTGYNARSLYVSLTIKNPNTTNYKDMFVSTARNNSYIFVNYTTETEALVEQMIATKGSGSNVLKGSLVLS